MPVLQQPIADANQPPFSRQSLAERWGVSDRSIDQWISDGKLRAIKLVRQTRIPYQEVMRAEREGIPR